MNAFLTSIQQFLGRLSRSQRITLGLALAGSLAVLIGLAYWANQPDYTLLFGRLDPTDANRMVETLQEDNIPYELKENGTAIYVPRDDVHELRLRFAGEGVVSDGLVGYELFDQGTLGMTDFMQKLNMKRALEGELSRTISNIRGVETARVHLVIPERSPFRETQTEPSASVVLQLKGSRRPDAEQIGGITALVGGAVENLVAANVTVLDTRGNLLSDPNAGDTDVMLSSNQLKMQRAIEIHLAEKGQTMLDQVLGPRNALVRVAANLDFSRSVEESETIDPESQTIISEERLEEQGPQGDNAESAVRNYDLSRTRVRSEKSVGDIQYLTVSVILNYKKQPAAGEAQPAAGEAGEAADGQQLRMYSDAELQEIEALVQNAVGFSPDRGDRFAIHQTRFDTSVDDQIAADLEQQRQQERIQLYLRYGLIMLALLLAVWLIRSASRRVSDFGEDQEEQQQLAGASAAPQLGDGSDAAFLDGIKGIQGARGAGKKPGVSEEEGGELVLVEDYYTSKLSPEAKAKLKAKHLLYEEIRGKVIARPGEAADIIRTWLAEDDLKAMTSDAPRNLSM